MRLFTACRSPLQQAHHCATISESLGHSSIAITSTVYVHLLDEGRREKAQRLDAYLRDAVGPS